MATETEKSRWLWFGIRVWGLYSAIRFIEALLVEPSAIGNLLLSMDLHKSSSDSTFLVPAIMGLVVNGLYVLLWGFLTLYCLRYGKRLHAWAVRLIETPGVPNIADSGDAGKSDAPKP
jgi:hypothetical protein